MVTSSSSKSQLTSKLVDGQATLSERELLRVSNFIGEYVGIQLEPSKHTLVEGRLRRRLRQLKFTCFKEYLDFVLESPQGQHERLHLIDALTTNKTDFYREPIHFTYLVDNALPEISREMRFKGRNDLTIWSAGCSSGEEVYTLSIVMSEAIEKFKGLRFEILGTDISKSSLDIAKSAVYSEKRIAPVPMLLRKKFFLRSKNKNEEFVKMGPYLRSKVQFGSLNLMVSNFALPHKMDVIFCRNVMIYFNNKIREKLIQQFERQLVPGGYLFVGHSESLNHLKHGMEQVAPMVYRKSL
ncbi:MAG: chemotaxis protein CheR [Gammaproteobacteria bacterium]|nr:chemotaxis protein CheR [Gammaproteobacteria bacterium]